MSTDLFPFSPPRLSGYFSATPGVTKQLVSHGASLAWEASPARLTGQALSFPAHFIAAKKRKTIHLAMGQKEKTWGPQVGAIFPFTNRFFLGVLFLTHNHLSPKTTPRENPPLYIPPQDPPTHYAHYTAGLVGLRADWHAQLTPSPLKHLRVELGKGVEAFPAEIKNREQTNRKTNTKNRNEALTPRKP